MSTKLLTEIEIKNIFSHKDLEPFCENSKSYNGNQSFKIPRVLITEKSNQLQLQVPTVAQK